MTIHILLDQTDLLKSVTISGFQVNEFLDWARKHKIQLYGRLEGETLIATLDTSQVPQIRKWVIDTFSEEPETYTEPPALNSDIEEISRSASLWLITAANLYRTAAYLRVPVDKARDELSRSQMCPDEPFGEIGDFYMLGPMLMLYGMCLECALKGRYILLNPSVVPREIKEGWWKGHNLREIAKHTGWPLETYSKEQLVIFDHLTRSIQLGRYPYHGKNNQVGLRWGWGIAAVVDQVVHSIFHVIFGLIIDDLKSKSV